MSFVTRAIRLISSPKSEWAVIASEEPEISTTVVGYAVPLAGLAALAIFIGYGFIGMTIPMIGKIVGTSYGLAQALTMFIQTLISLFVTALVVNMLASTFQSEPNYGRALQLVAYSYTAPWVGGLLNVVPMLGIVGSLFGLYGIYLWYLGLPEVMKTPKEKVVVYMIVTVIILFAVFFVVGLVLTPIIFGIFNVIPVR